MKKFHIFIANTLFIFHCLIGIFILTGWMFSKIKLEYLTFLAIWLSCWIFLGYCPPSKWEFTLRRKYDKSIDVNAESIKYYMYKFFNKDIPSKSVFSVGIIIFIILIFLTFSTHIF
jgi:hypothetical protein